MNKFLSVIGLFLFVAACTFSPVVDQATFDVTATARAFPPLPTVEPQVVPPTATEELVPTPTLEPTVIAIATEEAPQQACEIKLNVSSNGDKIYHLPGGAYYNRVKIDFERGEGYACTEEDAVKAGFRRSSR